MRAWGPIVCSRRIRMNPIPVRELRLTRRTICRVIRRIPPNPNEPNSREGIKTLSSPQRPVPPRTQHPNEPNSREGIKTRCAPKSTGHP